jgi:signal transduction histidine kinase
MDTLKLSGGALHQYDAAANEFRLRASSGLPQMVIEQLRRVPANGAQSATLPPARAPDGKTCSFFSVPLMSQGMINGLLSVRADEALGDDTRDLMVRIGQQLGVVLDNATLLEDTTRRAALSTDLGRLGLALTAQIDRDSALGLLCRESLSIFNAHGAYIWLSEDDQLVGALAYGPGAAQFPGHQLAWHDHTLLPARAIKEWHPLHINHVAETAELPADFQAMTGAQSALAIPLLKASVPIGVLLLINAEDPTAFAQWLVDQVGMLGAQTALAIENIRLFDEVRHRLDQLRLVNETGRYATAILSPQDLLDGVAQKLSDTLQFDLVSVLQVEEGHLALHSVFLNGQTVPVDQIPRLRAPLLAVSERAARSAEPILDDDLYFDTEDGLSQQNCALAVPLIIADEVIGMLVVARHSRPGITRDDLDVLEPLASQLAISVSNARLFEKVRQQTVELEARVAQRTEEIRQQQERTEAILRSVADAVIVFDLMGQVVMTNPVARRLFDEHDLDMDLGARVGRLVSRALDAGADGSASTEIIELGGVALQAKAARVVEGEDVLGSVVVLRDISQFQELDRLKDQFVSNVSHELRTPLANLKLYLSLLQQGRPERQSGYQEVMDREIKRLTRLINDLLQLSRLQGEQRAERPLVREPVNLDALIDTVAQNNLAWAESERKELLRESSGDPLPVIMGDPDQLLRALTNLVSNAISYTPEGGRIIIRGVAGRAKPEWVIIEVEDTGIGIPPADLPHIYERFRRGSNVINSTIPGTGLGLAIIRDIVDLHGGTIEASSQEGQGSLFRIRLPVRNSL